MVLLTKRIIEFTTLLPAIPSRAGEPRALARLRDLRV
jgi:hypothetical protein